MVSVASRHVRYITSVALLVVVVVDDDDDDVRGELHGGLTTCGASRSIYRKKGTVSGDDMI